MRRFANALQAIIDNCGLSPHKLSQASGVSGGYLAKLAQGGINRPGKDKIASLLLALNHTISEINAVLAEYDYRPLHPDDIPALLGNNRGRKIAGGSLPQYDHIYFDLLLIVLERIGGRRILVKNRPSGVFMPHELYLQKEYPFEENDEAAIFRYQLTRATLVERRELFLAGCAAGQRSETFICRKCLSDYLERNLGGRDAPPGRAGLITRYFANALSLTAKRPDLQTIYLMDRCPYFHFLIQDADGPAPKVSYPGRKLHTYDNDFDKRMLEGFTTDLSPVVAHFRHEVEMCRGAVNPRFLAAPAEALRDHVVAEFERFGRRRRLEEELAGLMADDRLRLY